GFIEEKARNLPEYKLLMDKHNGQEDTVFSLLDRPREMVLFTWEGDTTVQMSPLDSLAYYAAFLHTGMMSLDASTRQIKAWMRRTHFARLPYVDVAQSRRQAGSPFKPFVYLTALYHGYPPCHKCVDSRVRINYVDSGEELSWARPHSHWV